VNLQHRIKKELQNYYKSRIKIIANDQREKFDSQNIKKIALLFFIKDKNDLDLAREVIKLVRKEYKDAIGIFYSALDSPVDVITDRNFHIFNANDFDYRWEAGPELKAWIEQNKTDLLINFCFTDIPETTKLYSIIKSGFKISSQAANFKFNSNLIINIKENDIDFNAFYNLAIQNLRMLNIKRN